MILSAVAATTIWLAAVTGSPFDQPAIRQLSTYQKNVAARGYVESATRCIALSVLADGRFRQENPTANLGDLIVDSVPKCLDPLHNMIQAYDQYFGEGAGESFFTGPYLDTLPNAIVNLINNQAH